ncbi:MAG: glycosyltransferase [Acidimicrobiales bacterium]
MTLPVTTTGDDVGPGPIDAARPASRPLVPVRLGIYVDCRYEANGGELMAHRDAIGFLTFAREVGGHFSRVVHFGRAATDGGGVGTDGADEFVSLGPAELVMLPSYGSVRDLRRLAGAAGRTATAMWRGLDRVDAVWVFGPHPFAVLLAVLALVRGRRLVLGVRQDTMAYFRARLPSPRWRPVLVPVAALDRAFRLLARFRPATVVGRPNVTAYGGPRPGLFDMTVALTRRSDIVPPRPGPLTAPIELLAVGRIDHEKNPLLLVDALADLEADEPGRFRLTWIGTGPLAGAVAARAEARGVGGSVHLAGFVPFGPELLDRYRRADMFVHTSVTEGSPQVLFEAAAAGLPIVATDVGGVAAAMGPAAELVPPADLAALVAAVRRVTGDDECRRRREDAHRLALATTLEGEAERTAAFIAAATTHTDRPAAGVTAHPAGVAGTAGRQP